MKWAYWPFVRFGREEGFWWAEYAVPFGTQSWRVAGCDSRTEARTELREFVEAAS